MASRTGIAGSKLRVAALTGVCCGNERRVRSVTELSFPCDAVTIAGRELGEVAISGGFGSADGRSWKRNINAIYKSICSQKRHGQRAGLEGTKHPSIISPRTAAPRGRHSDRNPRFAPVPYAARAQSRGQGE